MSKNAQSAAPAAAPPTETNAPWFAFIVIVMAQIQMAFNVNALPVSIGPLVEDLGVAATDVGTALVMYSLFVAAFVILGAKLSKLIGARLTFQVSVLAHGAAMVLMATATDGLTMNISQALAGLAEALLVPSLVVLIASNYRGRQQSQALGILAGTPAIAGASAFFLAGFLATALSWRISFGILGILAIIIFVLSFRLKGAPREKGIGLQIDFVGAVLIAAAVALLSFGFNNLVSWGVLRASSGAPFTILGMSPAPFMIVLGIVFLQAFVGWLQLRQIRNRPPLLSLEVFDSPVERATLVSLFLISALGPAINFLVPMFLQIVRDQSSMETAIAMVPYTLSIFLSAVFIVRTYDRLSSRQIGAAGFIIVSIGLAMLAFTVQNDWSSLAIIASLIVLGLGEGSLLTLVFNVLVSEAPQRLAGDVGALRGTTNNLSTAIGTALASVLIVSFLSLIVFERLENNPQLPPSLVRQVNLDNINFVGDSELDDVLAGTTATPEQRDAALQLNQEARLEALRNSLLVLMAIAMLGIIPALGMPAYSPRDADEEAAAEAKPAADAA